jgi:predicted lipoprotein with Yx(FWY)xxD motif
MISLFSRAATIAVAAALLSACSGGGASSGPSAAAPSGPTPTTMLATAQLNGAPGFVNPASRTVYIFDLDLTMPGTSQCNGACAANWPHVAPPAGVAMTTGFSTITRTDGSTQLTYNGRPLYTFSGDTAAGQANGDGLNAFGGLWHISRPAGSSTGSSPNPPTAPY